MAPPVRPLTVGLPRTRMEPGERRDFLPSLAGSLAPLGVRVKIESGIGTGIGLTDVDYLAASILVTVVDRAEAFAQDIVLSLRAPEDEFARLRPGALLVSMLHFSTRPARVRRLLELGVEAISLDAITDNEGHRLVEDLRSVAWNGLDAAFGALERTYPGLTDPARPPVSVMIMGAGAVGKHAVEAATKYGSRHRCEAFDRMALPGVEVITLGRNLTANASYMLERLRRTDILVDATQRSDPGQPLVPNRWLDALPRHAVICDLVVDPYLPNGTPPTVRGIEGIPQGNLDQYAFAPDDPAWTRTIPGGVPSGARRTVVSCYSWPGVRARESMEHYGRQLAPLLRTLIRCGGIRGLGAEDGPEGRALHRACLRTPAAMAAIPADLMVMAH